MTSTARLSTHTTRTAAEPEPGRRVEVDAVVVGAGFAGLYAVHALRGQGLRVLGVEAGSDVGGTWYWNRYPGARCDAVSALYSFSFDEQLQQEWSWSERYAAQPEILRYLGYVADRLDLRRSYWFDTRVEATHYDETTQRWTLRTSSGTGSRSGTASCSGTGTGDVVTSTYCVLATGCLSQARVPDIPGLATTSTPVVHTGAWPHEGVDVTGRRVAVIGTGSSGLQLIPKMAESAAQVVVLQRTPAFSVPARNAATDPEQEREIKAAYPEIRAAWRRGELVGAGEELRPGSVFRRSVSVHSETPEQREREFARRWESGGPFFTGAYGDILVDPVANEAAADFIRRRIAELVDDPKTAETLTPRGFPVGAKRLCVDTDYFVTYNRANVTLVDVAADSIERVEDGAVVLASGARHEVDLIACATGFDAMTGALLAMDVRGRGGVRLADAWRDGPQAYLGLAVHGFPNLFMITGPGSPSVLGNVVAHIEQHVEYLLDLLAESRSAGLGLIEAEPAAQSDWADLVAGNAAATLFAGVNSWYAGANVPGKSRVFMPFVGGVGRFRELCDDARARDWHGFARKSLG